jgi:hypothetical protein
MNQEKVLQSYPNAKLIGPSGDGCHIEIDGQWFAYGNLPENAWKAAAAKIEGKRDE